MLFAMSALVDDLYPHLHIHIQHNRRKFNGDLQIRILLSGVQNYAISMNGCPNGKDDFLIEYVLFKSNPGYQKLNSRSCGRTKCVTYRTYSRYGTGTGTYR